MTKNVSLPKFSLDGISSILVTVPSNASTFIVGWDRHLPLKTLAANNTGFITKLVQQSTKHNFTTFISIKRLKIQQKTWGIYCEMK